MGALLDFLIDRLPQFRRARLASLYSDFRQQQYSNPDGYAANIAAWELALAVAAESQAIPGSSNFLCITAGHELLEALESKEWGRPSALGAVFSEAISTGHFVSKAVFLQSKSGLTESSSASISWNLVSWATKQLGVSSWIPDKVPQGAFVVSANLKRANEKMLAWLSESRTRVDQILPIAEFKMEAVRLLDLQDEISDDDLQVLLVYLSRDCKLLAYGNDFIKFKTSAPELLKITEEDRSIASLKSLIHDLTAQVRQVSDKIADLDRKSRTAIANKDRNAALRYLRYKKAQGSILHQRSDTLFQLEDILDQIEQAANQVEVIGVLKSSTSVLKGLNAQIGDLNTFNDVLDGINEEILKTQEVGDAIGQFGQAGLALDEEEIDDELEALENEAQRDKVEADLKKVRERLDHLPTLQQLPATEMESIVPEVRELETI